jgi:release factor glutamine methyltransferase
MHVKRTESYNAWVQLGEALKSAIAKLQNAGVDEARISVDALVFHVLGCDRAYLFAHPERELSAAEQDRLEALVERRAAGEPLQYLTGKQEFWGAEFEVSPAVLIPRPETEHLVEETLKLAGKAPLKPKTGLNGPPGGSPRATSSRLKIVDVGTGSGAIAISLARELPEAEVWAVDLSPEALAMARCNAERLGAQVQFAQSDVLAAVERSGSFDFVVSNPPYVGLNEADKVQQVVRDHEPQMAVFAGDDGLAVIRRLIPQAHEALRAGGWLLMEIGYSMSERVMALLADWDEVHTVPDLAGIPRVVVARKR